MEKLSSLMLKSFPEIPKGKYNYITVDDNTGEIVAACALGRVVLALGLDKSLLTEGKDKIKVCDAISKACEVDITYQLLRHPIHHSLWSLHSIIVELNDYYEWSVEKIAEWLASKGY